MENFDDKILGICFSFLENVPEPAEEKIWQAILVSYAFKYCIEVRFVSLCGAMRCLSKKHLLGVANMRRSHYYRRVCNLKLFFHDDDHHDDNKCCY